MRKIKTAPLMCLLALLSVIAITSCKKDEHDPLIELQSKTASIDDLKESISLSTRIPLDSISYDEAKRIFTILEQYDFSLEEVEKQHRILQNFMGGSLK